MKFLPLLALLAIGSPALANDTLNITTTDRKTFTVQRNNVNCKVTTGGLRNERQNWKCSAYGVMTDLVGNKYQYNEEGKYCAFSMNNGNTWDWTSNDILLNMDKNSLTCVAVRRWNNI